MSAKIGTPTASYGGHPATQLFNDGIIFGQDGFPIYVNPRHGFLLEENFHGLYSAGDALGATGFQTVVNGSSTMGPVNATDGRAGLWFLRSDAAAIRRSVVHWGTNFMVLAGAKTYFEAQVYFPGLSVVTDQFETYIGLADSTSENDPTNGVNFLYEQKNNGDVWECQVIGGSTETNDVLTDAVADSTWYKLGIIVDDVTGGGTPAAKFYIDGTLVSTVTTNLPTTGEDLGIVIKQQSATGNTVASTNDVYIDYMRCAQIYTTKL